MASQKIRRNVQRQVLFALAALACAAVAVWAFRSIHFGLARWGITIVAGLAALLVYGFGSGTAGYVDCPHCDLVIHDVDPKTNLAVLCPHCRQFSTGTAGSLDVTPPDHVATLPVFGADLPEQLGWPPGCSVCEQPATRTIEGKLVDERPGSPGRDLVVGVASLGVLKAIDRTTYRIAAPHCAQHDDGVKLVTPRDLDAQVAIAFRSFSYYQKFIALNHVGPRALIVN